MRNNAIHALFIFVTLMALGCASFRMQSINSDLKITPLLPPLEVEIDVASIQKAFGPIDFDKIKYIGKDEHGNTQVVIKGGAPVMHPLVVKYDTLYDEAFTSQDPRIVNLAVEVIRKEMFTNIIDSNGKDKYGYAIIRLKSVERSGSSVWFWTSALTVFTINLLGYPILSQTAEIEIEIEILNSKKQSLATYSGQGKTTKYSALYWGYSPWGAAKLQDGRPSLTKATIAYGLLDALNNLKPKIQSHSSRLNSRLVESGPIVIN